MPWNFTPSTREVQIKVDSLVLLKVSSYMYEKTPMSECSCCY